MNKQIKKQLTNQQIKNKQNYYTNKYTEINK